MLRTDNAVANWKEIISGELTTTRTFGKKFAPGIKITSTVQNILEGTGLLYIPLQVRGTEAAVADVKLTYTIKIKDGTQWDAGQEQYVPVEGSSYQGEAVGQFALDNNLEGQKQNINIVLHKKYDLLHLYFDLEENADEPSYSRITK